MTTGKRSLTRTGLRNDLLFIRSKKWLAYDRDGVRVTYFGDNVTKAKASVKGLEFPAVQKTSVVTSNTFQSADLVTLARRAKMWSRKNS